MIEHFHLPDIPDAGYESDRARHLSDEIMLFMRSLERDRPRLLTIVIEGIERWRKVAGEIWRPYRIGEDHQLLDSIFHYFELQAVRPGVQAMLLQVQQNPQKWKEIMDVTKPHLEREREDLRLMEKWG